MAQKRRNIGIPSGVVFPFAGTSAPYGYLICDGSAISRTDYPDLFLTLGTSHGQGDGSTTFNLPDYRGRFLRGVDGLAGNDPDKASRTAMATGGNTGNTVGSVQDEDTKAHSHNLFNNDGPTTAPIVGSNLTSTSYVDADPNANTNYFSYSMTSTSSTSPNLGRTGDRGGNESRPKNVNVNYIIKV